MEEKMENTKTVGEYICSKRKEHNLTQKELADKLFVTESAVSKWERNKSFPDISLVLDICKILEISEHEFLTASEDLNREKSEKIVSKYLKMSKVFKITQIILYLIPIIVCLICNIAIDHTLSWFFIVLTGEMVGASLTLLPFLLTKKRILISLASCLVSILLLLITCVIYTGSGSWLPVTVVSIIFGFITVFLPLILKEFNIKTTKALIYFSIETISLLVFLAVINFATKGTWFFNLALPISLICLLYAWILMLVIRYSKIDKALKTSICLVISSIFLYFIKGIIDKISYLGGYISKISSTMFPRLRPATWTTDIAINENIIVLTSLFFLLLAIIFFIISIKKSSQMDA